MKILFVSTQAIFSKTRFGGAKRLYYLARELEERAELHVVCMDAASESPDPASYPEEFRNIFFVPLKRAEKFLEKISFLYDFSNALKLHKPALSAFLKGHRFDAVFMAYPGALHFMNMGLISWPKNVVYLEDDLLLEIMQANARKAAFPSRIMKFARYWQAKLFYRDVMRRISRVVCISPQEERVVLDRWPHVKTSLLGYGIPLEEYPMLPPPLRANVLGFIGNYRHAPNADAAYWLVETLFPAVLKRIPDAQLLLCGVGFPEDLRGRCANHDSIRILDNVADLSTFYGSISVFVNALRTGRGLRTKVVEAAAYGRPIVSTPLGAEGLEGFDLGLFETGEDLAELLVHSGLESAQRAVHHNREVVEREFSMNGVGSKLLTLLSPAP